MINKVKYVYYTNEHYREGLSYVELRKLRGNCIERMVSYGVDGKNVRVSIRSRDVNFIGNKHFIRSNEVAWFAYKNGKFFGSEPIRVFNLLPDSVLPTVFLGIDLAWMKDLPAPLLEFAARRTIFKSILCHNIYSQETLVKAIGRRVYKMKDFSWRVLRDFIVTKQFFSIWDLMCFTKNYTESMKCLISIPQDYMDKEAMEKRQLLEDMLRMAADENGIIDFRWSLARQKMEHKKQIERALGREMDEKSDEQIYSDSFRSAMKTPNIRLLTTEREVFFEGAAMHHCLYNAYFQRIKDNRYMAFHMTSPEDCTMGVCLRDGVVVLDQIYLKYDKHVQDSTRALAETFVNDHKELIGKILQEYHREEDPADLPF